MIGSFSSSQGVFPIKSRRIENVISHDRIQKDLESYIELCYSEGATEAVILNKCDIIIDPRVHLKCLYPKCKHFNSNAHCPPHSMEVDRFKRIVEHYCYGIMFMIRISPEKMLSVAEEEDKIEDRKKIAQMVNNVESRAFYDGYYLATGFGAGSCRMTWCPELPCQVLEGKGCRFPEKARPSMESVGFDVFRMAATAGWEIYPIGRNCELDQVPHGLRVGMVLIC